MTTVRVMTWNLHGSALPNLDEVARRIASFAPDVVGVQEVRAGQARRLARRLGMEHRWARKHFPYSPLLWWRAEGLAIFSRTDLRDHRRFVLNPSVSALTFRRRIAHRVTIALESGVDVAVFNTHLASDGAADERHRQATVIAGRIAQDTLPVILTGDLNANNEPAVLVPLTSLDLHDMWPSEAGAGFTCDAMQPSTRIDYVLAPSGWTTIAAEVPPTDNSWAALSDHLPVIVTMQVG